VGLPALGLSGARRYPAEAGFLHNFCGQLCGKAGRAGRFGPVLPGWDCDASKFGSQKII
jgi:hypothetical protein